MSDVDQKTDHKQKNQQARDAISKKLDKKRTDRKRKIEQTHTNEEWVETIKKQILDKHPWKTIITVDCSLKSPCMVLYHIQSKLKWIISFIQKPTQAKRLEHAPKLVYKNTHLVLLPMIETSKENKKNGDIMHGINNRFGRIEDTIEKILDPIIPFFKTTGEKMDSGSTLAIFEGYPYGIVDSSTAFQYAEMGGSLRLALKKAPYYCHLIDIAPLSIKGNYIKGNATKWDMWLEFIKREPELSHWIEQYIAKPLEKQVKDPKKDRDVQVPCPIQDIVDANAILDMFVI